VDKTRKSLEFIRLEQGELASQIEQVEADIAQVKADNPGVLPEDMTTNQRLLERTEAELRDAKRQLDLARGDQAFWKNQVLTAASLSSERDESNPVRKLGLLELELAEFRSRGFTEAHPDIIATLDEMERLREQIAADAAETDEDEPAANFAQQQAQSEEKRAGLRVVAMEDEIKRLTQQEVEIRDRLAATPRVAEQLDALERERSQLGLTLADYSRRLQEASAQANLERRQLGEQLRILETAYPPTEPSSPNRPLILVLGMLMGLAVGVGSGVVLEGLDSSVHSARQLQTHLSIPVLAAIPTILLESDEVRQRARMLRNAVLASGVAFFVLVGGAATYVYVNGAPGWASSEGAADESTEGASAPANRRAG
ncbi:MAG: hypothetical protein MJE66_13445, partial [Proteobacteria bacterium]|nr:hypothetical protein [Pseudomonadota bacterium]